MAAHNSKRSECDRLLVAAIDFGTTYSGYAFSFKDDYEKEPTKVQTNDWTAGSRGQVFQKTPTALLLNPKQEFDSFGFEAEDKYSNLTSDGKHKDWYYFRRYKMMLFDEDGLRRDVTLKDDMGHEMPAMEIFSLSIGYLKKHLLSTLNKQSPGVTEEDIQWVLTVPAIWNDSAKQFMREAANQAGILDDQLMFALESEAASIYCMHLPPERFKMSTPLFSEKTKYMVLDVGGGTADISLHEVQHDGILKALHQATGGAWGDKRVDDNFRQFLIKIVGDDVTQKLIKEFPADYINMMRDFEITKRTIRPDTTGKVTIRLPTRLRKLYEEKSGETIEEALSQMIHMKGKLTWKDDKLSVEAEIVQKMFEDSTLPIVEEVQMLLEQPVCAGTDRIIGVGGFSECEMLQHEMKKHFPMMIVPEDAELAVLKGAVLFGHRPQVIGLRIAKQTYGVDTCRDFKAGVDPEDKKWILKDGRVKCNDVFSVHVRKGQILKVNEAQESKRYYPMVAGQSAVSFNIYTSDDTDPQYVTDSSCKRIGELEVEMPDTSRGTDRPVLCKMIFGGTELRVEAKEENSNKVTKAKFNFLGDNPNPNDNLCCIS